MHSVSKRRRRDRNPVIYLCTTDRVFSLCCEIRRKMNERNSEILNVKLTRNEEGFGFSLLGKVVGISHVIYEVIEDSPAAYEVRSKLCKKMFCLSSFCFSVHLLN